MEKTEHATGPAFPDSKSMSFYGIGFIWLGQSFFFSLPLILGAWAFPDFFLVTRVPPLLFRLAGGILLFLGLLLFFSSALLVKKHYRNGTLCTTGPFALCRNPIYGAWIFLLLPGVVLLLRMPLLFLISFIMYFCLLKPLKKEEDWLLRKYGAPYEVYTQRVPRLCPGFAHVSRIWRKQRYY